MTGRKNRWIRVVLGLIAFNAAIGVFTLLGGQLNETSGKVLGTSLLATLAALLSITCLPQLRAAGVGPIALLGIIAAWTAACLFIAGMWAELDSGGWWKVAGSAQVVAVGAAIVSLLAGWRTAGEMAWVAPTTQVLTLVAAAMVAGAIWYEVGSGYWRLFGITAVLMAAGVVATPVVRRLEGPVAAGVPVGYCPFCGHEVDGATERAVVCGACRRRFEVLIGRADLRRHHPVGRPGIAHP